MASPTLQPRTLVLYTALAAGVLFILASLSQTMSATASSKSTSLKGWHSRATPISESFKPTLDALRFAVLLNAPADPEGFTVALFAPDLAVDASGKVLRLKPTDFDAFMSAIEDVMTLPKPDTFRNTWGVKQEVTSQVIDRLLVPVKDTFDETSVQGYKEGKTELKAPVGDITQLPAVLYDLFGVFGEAREGYELGRSPAAVVEEIKALLGEAV